MRRLRGTKKRKLKEKLLLEKEEEVHERAKYEKQPVEPIKV